MNLTVLHGLGTLNEGLDTLIWAISQLLQGGKTTRMWKRDKDNAFRYVPIAKEHEDLAWVVWEHDDQVWASRHRSMPFGGIGSHCGYHRVGEFVAAICQTSNGHSKSL